MKALKPYALGSSVTNEKLLNSVLGWYADAGRVSHRDGGTFRLDAAQTSRMMNGKIELPDKVKEAAALCDLEAKIEGSLVDALPEAIDCDDFGSLAASVIGLCGRSQKAVEERLSAAAGVPEKLIAIALIAAVKANNVMATKRQLRSRGTGSVWVEAGDLFAKAFGKKRKGTVKPIVVIPVDTGFRTHVTRGYENEAHPAVADTTLHGQWLTRVLQSEKNLSEGLLAKRIDGSLALHAKPAGKEGGEWPIGTVAVVETDAAVFYLLAISTFDGDNNAHATRDDVRDAIRALIAFYDRNGQGHDLYIPLMGTGLSRAGMSLRDAYEMLEAELCSDDVFIAGKATITVLPDVAADIGLTE